MDEPIGDAMFLSAEKDLRNRWSSNPGSEVGYCLRHIDILTVELEACKWQPIDTAPKDGTLILCWWRPISAGGPGGMDVARYVEGNGWCDQDDDDRDLNTPCFWMPLPTPTSGGSEHGA